MRASLASLIVLLLISACSSPSARRTGPKWIEYSVVAEPESEAGQTTTTYEYFGDSHSATDRVEVAMPVQRGRISRSYLAPDIRGNPAVCVVLDPKDVLHFSAFTGANVGRELVIIVDGKVTSKATIAEKLPGKFQIYGRFTEAENQRLMKALQ